MKRFSLALVLCIGFVCSAHASRIYNFSAPQVTFVFGASDGDNAIWSLGGPKLSLYGGAGAFCPQGYCMPEVPLAPGTRLNPSVTVFWEDAQGSVTIGGQNYSAELFVSSLTAGSFTFPQGGSVAGTYTVSVPATFSVVNGRILNQAGSPLNIYIPPGRLTMTFDYVPASNGQPAAYFFSQGQYVVATPEPATLALVASGLTLLGLNRRRRKSGM